MVPIDAVLLVAVVVALAVAFKGRLMPSWLFSTLRISAYPMMVIGVIGISCDLVDMYMVEIVRVPPGQPMYLDELAYPIHDALLGIARCVALLGLAFFFRDYARHRKLSAST